MASPRVLGLFAKHPVAGQVKTRLASATSPEWAARVAAAFLYDAVERLARIPARRVLAFAPDDAGPALVDAVSDLFTLVPQGPGNLGQRMARFFTAQVEAGAPATVLLGTDSPTVPLDYVERAFAELETSDVVLGPAADGGYYVIGCSSRVPPIFDGVAWSSAGVLAETVARLPAPWRLALLPPWYDVDTLDDWQVLRGHLAALARAGIDPHAPRTLALAQDAPG